jgi:hypothetical protein
MTQRIQTFTYSADFPADELRQQAHEALMHSYELCEGGIRAKARQRDALLAEKVLLVDDGGNLLLAYDQADLCRDTGLSLVGNPQPWL